VGNDTVDMFVTEQAAFANLIRDLTPEQWELPSLCPGWTVRDVVVHTAFHTHRGLKETLGSTEKYTPLLVEHNHADTIDGLIAWFASRAPAKARRSTINLCELVIHQQDVRRAVASTRDYPEETLRICLEQCTTVIGNVFVIARRQRLGHGLRLVATDIPWARGNGPEVAGTGEAILMAIAGRSAALADITGPGVAVVAERYGTVAMPAALSSD